MRLPFLNSRSFGIRIKVYYEIKGDEEVWVLHIRETGRKRGEARELGTQELSVPTSIAYHAVHIIIEQIGLYLPPRAKLPADFGHRRRRHQ